MTMPMGEPDWGYRGAIGPERWADLSGAYATCATGTMQSPIDLAGAVPGDHGDLALAYHYNVLTFTDRHRTLSVEAEPGGLVSYLGKEFNLAEVHFHAPSEHTIAGRNADLEAHYVHRARDRSVAVIGVLFDQAEGTHPVDELITAIPETPGGTTSFEHLRDIQQLIPLSSRRYRYTGSLTTPPCTEGVAWIVMEDIGSVNPSALRTFASRYGPNNRPTQPLNDREVTLG